MFPGGGKKRKKERENDMCYKLCDGRKRER